MSVALVLATAKEGLHVDHTAQDIWLQAQLDGVEEWVEDFCGVALSRAAATEDVDGGGYALRPTRRPVASVTSVTDLETGVAEAAGDYYLERDELHRADEWRWPEGAPGRWRVVYVGGFSAVPAGLVMCMYDLVARKYANRGGKLTQGAAGFGVTWQSLADSDVMQNLDKYRRAGIVG